MKQQWFQFKRQSQGAILLPARRLALALCLALAGLAGCGVASTQPAAATVTPTPRPRASYLPTATPSPATALDAPTVVNANANLRAGPGTEYDRVGSAAQGDAVEIGARNAAGDWSDVPQAVRDTLATIGCSSQVVTATITPQGGSITSLDGLVEVQFAAGAFANQVEVFLQPQVGQPTSGLMDIDRFFEVGVASRASSEGGENPAQTFATQVQYRNHAIVGLYEASLVLYWWNGTQWVKEQSSVVNAATNMISAAPNHLGRFAVLGEEAISVYLPLAKIR